MHSLSISNSECRKDSPNAYRKLHMSNNYSKDSRLQRKVVAEMEKMELELHPFRHKKTTLWDDTKNRWCALFLDFVIFIIFFSKMFLIPLGILIFSLQPLCFFLLSPGFGWIWWDLDKKSAKTPNYFYKCIDIAPGGTDLGLDRPD